MAERDRKKFVKVTRANSLLPPKVPNPPTHQPLSTLYAFPSWNTEARPQIDATSAAPTSAAGSSISTPPPSPTEGHHRTLIVTEGTVRKLYRLVFSPLSSLKLGSQIDGAANLSFAQKHANCLLSRLLAAPEYRSVLLEKGKGAWGGWDWECFFSDVLS